ncbi:MAG: hypothetical protein WCP82_10225 [Alphaproteobacteria bacterium]
MAALNPFTPAGTVTLSVSSTTGSATLPTTSFDQLLVTAPAGGAIAFIRWGASPQTAVTTDTPILPGSVQIFTIPSTATTVAAITGSSTQTLYLTVGQGS